MQIASVCRSHEGLRTNRVTASDFLCEIAMCWYFFSPLSLPLTVPVPYESTGSAPSEQGAGSREEEDRGQLPVFQPSISVYSRPAFSHACHLVIAQVIVVGKPFSTATAPVQGGSWTTVPNDPSIHPPHSLKQHLPPPRARKESKGQTSLIR